MLRASGRNWLCLRVLAVVHQPVLLANGLGLFGHAAVVLDRADALGSFVFAQHFGAHLSFFSESFQTMFDGFSALLGVRGKANTDQRYQAVYLKTRKTAHILG
ncbi:hypothetical protein AUC43_18180 [Hymenobacter sedentarius]|uniref:Uncharacterized protein n=1 Tax=Hymenobacter sedentarius TaxID=1411621 RepID=A0A0U3SL26_9BACT|nr:hypothetical protein AUC43_18180 [Hymenobacter sedentarius]